MVHHIGKGRKGTRAMYRRPVSERGKVPIRKFMQKFESGQKVVLKVEPFSQKGLYFPRFHGKVGTISKMQGKCYIVSFMDHKKEKLLIVNPVHLKKV